MAVPKVHEMAIFLMACIVSMDCAMKIACAAIHARLDATPCDAMSDNTRCNGFPPASVSPSPEALVRLRCLTLHFVELVRKFAAQVHRRNLRCRFQPIRRRIVRWIKLLHHSHPILFGLLKRPQCQALARRFIQRCLIYARSLALLPGFGLSRKTSISPQALSLCSQLAMLLGDACIKRPNDSVV